MCFQLIESLLAAKTKDMASKDKKLHFGILSKLKLEEIRYLKGLIPEMIIETGMSKVLERIESLDDVVNCAIA